MTPRLDPVASDESLPKGVEVVIIGGGIIGAAAALFLAERGIPVLLCEKGRIGAEQSGRNWGWCRTMGRDTREIPLSMESLRIWRDLNRRVEGETGYRQNGIVYLCETQAEVDAYEKWLAEVSIYQPDARLLGSAEIANLAIGSARRWAGALHTPSDGVAEPQKAAPAIAAAARRMGAKILQDCAVRTLQTTGGRVSGVVTELGEVACGTVLLAGGAWSRLFCGNIGIDLPQLKVRASVMRIKPLTGVPDWAAGSSNFSFRKRLDGGYTIAQRRANLTEIVPDSFRLFRDFLPAFVRQRKELRLKVGRRFLEEARTPRRWRVDETSPFEKVRILDPEPTPSVLAEARRYLSAAFPAFAAMEVVESWGGLVDATPDAVPVISPVASLPGFFIATGFSGHGFGIGPAAGQLAADLVSGRLPAVDPAPFRLDRFARAAKARVNIGA